MWCFVIGYNRKAAKRTVYAALVLSNQGSNLDSTDPESVVLPITPLDSAVQI